MPRYFVTGLCMQGNKGGPALVLSLVNAIREYEPDAEFVFSVPSWEVEWPHEKKWGEKFGFEVVGSVGLKNVLPPFSLVSGRFRQFKAWWQALRSSDALIQMSAICYVGPPSGGGTFRATLASQRVFDLIFSKLASRPMLAWTQSYGPLTTQAVRFFARLDLQRQPIIFCRGDDCLNAVKELLPDAKVMSFPDVAVTLPHDKNWGAQYLSSHFSLQRPLVTLSPSAVMYARHSASEGANNHIRQSIEICGKLIAMGYRVLLVPHTLRPSHPDPMACDLAVAKIIYRLVDDSNVQLVEEDLSPSELKSIIANAEFHVGARYHSIVAALSSGVPAISISWHPKYRDLMRNYEMDEYVLEEQDVDRLTTMLKRIITHKEQLKLQLLRQQIRVAQHVKENARLFDELLKKSRL